MVHHSGTSESGELFARALLSMSNHLSLLCPVDFSHASRGALHYAAIIARLTGAKLTILTVDDMLSGAVADTRMGEGWSASNGEHQLRTFVSNALGVATTEITYETRRGKPAVEIRTAAVDGRHSLIVMGTHGRHGLDKWLLGTVAERVLRETAIPVLLVACDPGPLQPSDLGPLVSPILVPVDFSAGSGQQVRVAAAIAAATAGTVLVGHVLEPLGVDLPPGIDAAELSSERYRRACSGLQKLTAGGNTAPHSEILIAEGEPVPQITEWVQQHRVGLLVIALHDGVAGSPRMGSVTYRVLASTKVTTLAIPPAWSDWPAIGVTPQAQGAPL